MRRTLGVLFAVWLVSLPAVTAYRTTVWQDDLTLWRDASWGTLKPRPWLNRGTAAYFQGEYAEAEESLWMGDTLAAESTRPDRSLSRQIAAVNLAYVRMARGDIKHARALAHDIKRNYPTWGPAQILCEVTGC